MGVRLHVVLLVEMRVVLLVELRVVRCQMEDVTQRRPVPRGGTHSNPMSYTPFSY